MQARQLMKCLGYFLFLVFSFNASADDLAQLTLQQNQENQWVLENSQPIDPKDLKAIDRELYDYNYPRSYRTAANGFYINETWKRLRADNRIRKLTKELREHLGTPSQYCPTEKSCYDLVALYLPVSNFILIDYTTLNSEVISWVYHEVVHASQYFYRFPLDFGLMHTLNIQDPDFLMFYYETQANWHSLMFSENPAWLDHISSNASLILSRVKKSLVEVLTLKKSDETAKNWMTEWMPQEYLDNNPIESSFGVVINTTEYQTLFDMPEPFILKDLSQNFTLYDSLDFSFYAEYTDAIEKAYFGDSEFLTKRQNGDQKIFVKFHNNVYHKLKKDYYYGVHKNEKCHAPMQTVINSPSPLVSWFSVSPESFSQCDTYKDSDFWKHRDDLLKRFLNFKNRFFQGGTKGAGGPSLNIHPHIHPQLIIQPARELE